MTEIQGKTILDEIQYVPQLLSYIKMSIDDDKIAGKYLLTGSQKFTVTKGLGETLAGRIALLNLFPMSFSELISSGKLINDATADYFDYACLNDLYPELCANPLTDRQTWYSS